MLKSAPVCLILLTLTLLACQSAPPTSTPTATPAPTATALPAPTPASSAISAPEAESAAREWVGANLPQVQSDIGRSIASKADTLPSISVELQETVLESSQQWESGQADTQVNWTGASVDLKEDGKWTVRLDAETVTDVEHESVSGQLKAMTPFLFYGSGTQVENYAVLVEEAELTLAGMQIKAEMDQQLLDSEQVDSVLESLPDLPSPFSGN